MQSSSFHYLPFSPAFFLVLLLLFVVLIGLVQIGILGYVYERMGVSRGAAYAILLCSLAGAYINFPIAELHGGQKVVTQEVVDNWGTHYLVPVIKQWPGTVLAVNVGGALIPALLSFYLIVRHQIYGQAVLGITLVTVVVHWLATPVEHMGIAVPIFIPPVVSAVVAVMLSREYAAPLAYISGCLGTLIGADLLNLRVMGELGASIASIGGAGTFDGVFLTGILAVLLASNPLQTWRAQRAELAAREAARRTSANDR
jgi:uncharacterized membrane protein